MQVSGPPTRSNKPTPSLLMEIPNGAAGTKATLKLMSQMVKAGRVSPIIREKAVSLTRYLPQKDWFGEIKAIYQFVRDNIRYVRDINGVETIHTAEKILEQGAGDCDDKSILLASLLETIGHPTRFVAIGFAPGKFRHVFVETKVGDKWLVLETTEPVSLGWTPKGVKARMIWNN